MLTPKHRKLKRKNERIKMKNHQNRKQGTACATENYERNRMEKQKTSHVHEADE